MGSFKRDVFALGVIGLTSRKKKTPAQLNLLDTTEIQPPLCACTVTSSCSASQQYAVQSEYENTSFSVNDTGSVFYLHTTSVFLHQQQRQKAKLHWLTLAILQKLCSCTRITVLASVRRRRDIACIVVNVAVETEIKTK